ncbi:MAG TPA: hypothetical protein VJ715_14190 [Pyrinomonadaceae bacterium]|nr:hypothetical protein [Pyrinomonadaceae bacterium]
MKMGADRAWAKFCCLFLLTLALAACKPRGGAGNSRASAEGAEGSQINAELCRKYDACGCQAYDDCMKAAADSPSLNKPGVRECMLKSSCESLCLGVPDACINQVGGGQSGSGGAGGQQRSNCSAIRCGKNSDCPSDCYGGCDGVICYSF